MNSSPPNPYLRDLKPAEERALRRVFNRLSGWAAKQKLRRDIARAETPLAKHELEEKLFDITKKGGSVSKFDVSEMLRHLGKPSTKRYVRDMVSLDDAHNQSQTFTRLHATN